MRLVTAAESLEIDKQSVRNLKSDHWMEIAGRLMSQKIQELNPKQQPLLFLCGPGNNGGDGYVAIKNLVSSGFKNIKIVHSVPVSKLCQQKFDEIAGLDLEIWSAKAVDEVNLEKILSKAIVIDAVFGSGLSRDVPETWKRVFQRVNKSSKLTLSLDLPSGLDATTGNILGEAIRAHQTLAVVPLKSGLFLNAGPLHAGQLHKMDLGFPSEIVNIYAKSVRLIGQRTSERLRPRRKWSSNKTLFGHAVVVGGSAGFEGAAILACEAALRAGAGYVSLFSDSAKAHHRAPAEILLHSFEDFEQALAQKKNTAVIFGPGLKTSSSARKIFEKLKASSIPVLLDAGGFDFLKDLPSVPKNWILTPHAGELSRLLNIPASVFEWDRLKAATLAGQRFGGVIVFKGFRTVVHASGMNYIIGSGNPSLAKSGTGDVLSGVIGSYLAQGLSAEKAAVLGAWVHGHLADQRLRDGGSVNSLIASDLIEELKKF